MSAAADRRALDRFVAGLDVDEDALATAIVGKAVDRTVVVEALLKALASPQPALAVLGAQRIARMPDVAKPVAAQLTLIAAGEDEGDERVRTACAAALRAHGLPVPGDDGKRGNPLDPKPVPVFARLMLRALMMRSEQPIVSLEPVYSEDAPHVRGELSEDEDDVLHVKLTGLPPEFHGRRLELSVRRDVDARELTTIATAQARVSPDGAVAIRIEPELGSVADIRRWLAAGIELVASED